jgi:hypothetical protein
MACASGAKPLLFEFSRESQKCSFSHDCRPGRVGFSDQTCEYCAGSPQYTFWNPGSAQADSCRQGCSAPDPNVPLSGASCCPISDPAGGVFFTRDDCEPTAFATASAVGCRVGGFELGRWICPEELPKYTEWSNSVIANYPVPSGSGTCTGLSMVRGAAFDDISPACQLQVVSRTETSTLIKCSQDWVSSCDPVSN